jgi:deoxyribodipyrimidine photolyase
VPTILDILPDSAFKFHSGAADGREEFTWKGGETAALARLQEYLFGSDALGLKYVGATLTTDSGRSVLEDGALSKLSPWLAHGCISPRFIRAEVLRYEAERIQSKSTYYLLHELIWRDFVRYSSLNLGTSIFKLGGPRGIQPQGGWSNDIGKSNRWANGKTGLPFIDCFMRELVATGYSCHMGREMVGWFLARDLGMDWRMGAELFESVLIDYEPAANWFNWVYRCLAVAGNNPHPGKRLATVEITLWGPQHDPRAKFVQRWLPELAPLLKAGGPIMALEPWRLQMKSQQADFVNSARMAEQEGLFTYGKDYPTPLVYPLYGEGKFQTGQIALESIKAQEKVRQSKAKLKNALRSKLETGIGKSVKLRGRQDSHIAAVERTSSLSAKHKIGPKKRKLVPDKFLGRYRKDGRLDESVTKRTSNKRRM